MNLANGKANYLIMCETLGGMVIGGKTDLSNLPSAEGMLTEMCRSQCYSKGSQKVSNRIWVSSCWTNLTLSAFYNPWQRLQHAGILKLPSAVSIGFRASGFVDTVLLQVQYPTGPNKLDSFFQSLEWLKSSRCLWSSIMNLTPTSTLMYHCLRLWQFPHFTKKDVPNQWNGGSPKKS